jgi:AI-2 transport protein TqsA
MTPAPASRFDQLAPLGRRLADSSTLRVAATAVVGLAAAWWLLGQLESVLRPLLLAVFLAYVLMPYYARLRKWLPTPVALGLLGGLTAAVLAGLGTAVWVGLSGLAREEPELKAKVIGWVRSGSEWVHQYLPGVLGTAEDTRSPVEQAAGKLTDVGLQLANLTTLGLVEAATTGLYLLFLLTEAARFPDRVRAAYPESRADEILHVFGRINSAIISYLKAKVLSSLALAVPVGLILAGAGERFAALWAVLTFVCNFIPYAGSVVAYSLPVAFGLLQFDPGWRSGVVAVGLLACHLASASVVEPMILGRAVGLSPLVILAALSVWGLLWGLPGMFLAVPLTVVLVLVLDNIDATRPVARLLGG